MKGILLAGGAGTRLFPSTKCVSKQILPVYDKPAIYYPLSMLMLAGIKEILIISTPRDIPMIEDLLGDGSQIGINLQYAVQDQPNGIAEALIIGEKFIDGQPVSLILGDNLFYGHKFGDILQQAGELQSGAEVFAFHVKDPNRFGVVEMDKDYKAISLEEKPENPKSNWAVTGFYFYDGKAPEYARSLKPSPRGELEITDLNRVYREKGELRVRTLGRGVAWLDVGTHDSLLTSAQFVKTVEDRQGLKIGCIEEVAYIKGFIDRETLGKMAETYPNSTYGDYLRSLFQHGHI